MSAPLERYAVVTAATRSRIDSTLRGFIENGSVAGVSALVYEKGRETYFGAFGMADREAARPMARNAIVQIFSMTKPITGVALMTLYDQGKFQLDEPVSKYLPELAALRVYAGADASGAPILVTPRRAVTIRDLTRHTAGFATGADNPGAPGGGGGCHHGRAFRTEANTWCPIGVIAPRRLASQAEPSE
jgi:CubicO group peptidase (beta-lactamase class C family)